MGLLFSIAMGLIGVYSVASYGMATNAKKKGSSPERQPLLDSSEAPTESSSQVEPGDSAAHRTEDSGIRR